MTRYQADLSKSYAAFGKSFNTEFFADATCSVNQPAVGDSPASFGDLPGWSAGPAMSDSGACRYSRRLPRLRSAGST